MTDAINIQDITIVRRFEPTGGAIAVLDSDIKAQAFIAARVATLLDLREGDRVSALLVPNTVRPDATGYYAHRVLARRDIEAPAATVSRSDARPEAPKISARGNKLLSAMAGGDPWTAAELADELCLGVSEVTSGLEEMFARGDIARAVLYAKGGAMARTWYMIDHTCVEMFAVEEDE